MFERIQVREWLGKCRRLERGRRPPPPRAAVRSVRGAPAGPLCPGRRPRTAAGERLRERRGRAGGAAGDGRPPSGCGGRERPRQRPRVRREGAGQPEPPPAGGPGSLPGLRAVGAVAAEVRDVSPPPLAPARSCDGGAGRARLGAGVCQPETGPLFRGLPAGARRRAPGSAQGRERAALRRGRARGLRRGSALAAPPQPQAAPAEPPPAPRRAAGSPRRPGKRCGPTACTSVVSRRQLCALSGSVEKRCEGLQRSTGEGPEDSACRRRLAAHGLGRGNRRRGSSWGTRLRRKKHTKMFKSTGGGKTGMSG
ncbi:translation initiation factor IF-2-like [Falco naumanni]|uniref:translation initiation factor IF-2-like n=1 Tax=Falco naumanni TaxID=148594 RepID=UPI001ADEA01B|nr:translation initiation factor IF-2-like [Falco naumanni]